MTGDLTPSARNFEIRPDEEFSHLTRAPIAEAVIELTATARAAWDEHALVAALRDRLPEYPNHLPERQGELQVDFGATTAEALVRPANWHGVRVTSSNKLNIARFLRDRFSFSRLAPYQDWGTFQAEALRLWDIHRELARPENVQRIGVRFINRLRVPMDGADLDDFLIHAPQTPRGLESLPLRGFLHQEQLLVPNRPYELNVTRTVQPPETEAAPYAHLILDIDVYTTDPSSLDDNVIRSKLWEMRWLKNKAFFGSVRDSMIDSLRKEEQ